MHDAFGLIRLEKELSMRRAVQNNQLFRLGRFFVVLANSGKTRSVPARVIARHNVQNGGLEFVGSAIRVCAEQHQTVDLAWARLEGGITRGGASHAATYK